MPQKRNNNTANTIYLVVPNPAKSLSARVPMIYAGSNEAILTLSPNAVAYSGFGASTDDIHDTLRWAIDAEQEVFVRVVDSDGGRKKYPLERGDIELLLQRMMPRTNSVAGLLIHTAYYHAEVRECMLRDVRSSLDGAYNDSWAAAGVGPNPEEVRGLLNRENGFDQESLMGECNALRAQMRAAAKAIRETKKCFPSRKLAAIRKLLEQ